MKIAMKKPLHCKDCYFYEIIKNGDAKMPFCKPIKEKHGWNSVDFNSKRYDNKRFCHYYHYTMSEIEDIINF